MKIHIIFVEPAQYTLDLIENVYKDATYTFLYSQSKAVSLKDINLPVAHYCASQSFFSNFKHFIKLGRNNKLVISNGYNHWSFILLFFTQFLFPFYIGIESDTPYSEKKGLIRMIKKLYLNLIFKKKSVLGFAGGNGAHKDLFLKYGMTEERVFLLPMMIDNEKFYFDRSNTVNQSVDKGLVFLYVGRLDPEKNVMLLIDSFLEVVKKHTTSKLIIVGEGSCSEDLKSKQNKNIIFKGKQFGQDLINLYREADVLILPSLFEPWGLVVNEALSSSLAVICSNKVGAAEDLVRTPNSGWIFDVDQEKDLENIITHCINHPEDVKMKLDNGHGFMKNYWNYRTYSQNLQKIKNYVISHKI